VGAAPADFSDRLSVIRFNRFADAVKFVGREFSGGEGKERVVLLPHQVKDPTRLSDGTG
jgi:hypothetical protein